MERETHMQFGSEALSVLSTFEVGLLANYLFDGQTQRDLAKVHDQGQSTIGRVLRRAVGKLQQQGLDVRLRTRGRRRRPKVAALSQIIDRCDDNDRLRRADDDGD